MAASSPRVRCPIVPSPAPTRCGPDAITNAPGQSAGSMSATVDGNGHHRVRAFYEGPDASSAVRPRRGGTANRVASLAARQRRQPRRDVGTTLTGGLPPVGDGPAGRERTGIDQRHAGPNGRARRRVHGRKRPDQPVDVSRHQWRGNRRVSRSPLSSTGQTWTVRRPRRGWAAIHVRRRPAFGINSTGRPPPSRRNFRRGDGSPQPASSWRPGWLVQRLVAQPDDDRRRAGRPVLDRRPHHRTDTMSFSATVDGRQLSCQGTKAWTNARPTCDLRPATATNPVGSTHTVNAVSAGQRRRRPPGRRWRFV